MSSVIFNVSQSVIKIFLNTFERLAGISYMNDQFATSIILEPIRIKKYNGNIISFYLTIKPIFL